MKFTERSRGLYLEGITQTDIKFSNLAGRHTKSQFSDPNRPQHVFVVWIDDEDIVKELKGLGFNVKMDEDTYNDLGERYFLQFKAYPKMKVNRVTGKDETSPKVVMITSGENLRLEKESFGLVDACHIQNIDINFHPWEWEKGKAPVAVLDELWCTSDESAAGQNENYFEEKYGSFKDYEPGSDEVPFK